MKSLERAELLSRLGALRGWAISVGKLYEKEVDFVAMRGSDKRCVQVSDFIADARTFERERTPLSAIRDAYPKLILTRSGHAVYDNDGMQIVVWPVGWQGKRTWGCEQDRRAGGAPVPRGRGVPRAGGGR